MNATIALFRKEFKEQWRTNKILIMAASFFILGMSGPISLKFLPEILKNSGTANGMQIILTKEFTATEYVLNFFNQMPSLPMLILILLAMGTIAAERERGTHIFVLTKPVSRTQFIVTKYLTYLAVLTGVVLFTAVAALYYTLILSNSGSVALGAYTIVTLTMLSYMSLILAVVVLCSSLFRTGIAAGGVSFMIYLLIFLGNNFLPSSVSQYLPIGFVGAAPKIFAGQVSTLDQIMPVLVGFGLSALLIAIACITAEKREM